MGGPGVYPRKFAKSESFVSNDLSKSSHFYRVRVTEIDSLIDIGFYSMLSGHCTSDGLVHVTDIGKTRETARFVYLEFMHTML